MASFNRSGPLPIVVLAGVDDVGVVLDVDVLPELDVLPDPDVPLDVGEWAYTLM